MFPLLLANSVLGFFRLFAKFCACEGQGCLNSFLNPRSSPVGHLEIAVENLVVDALAEKKVTAGSEIITQGDQADYFYVLDEGECDVFKACALPSHPPTSLTLPIVCDFSLHPCVWQVMRHFPKEERASGWVQVVKHLPNLAVS